LDVALEALVLTRRLAVAIGFFFALIGAQAPEFAQQYRQRLGGALDELNRMIAQFDQEAKGQSLTREQGLDRLQHNGDPLARERAEAIDQDIDRAGRLARQRQAFADAGPVARVASFAQNFDATTLSQAWRDFEPAVPVTTEAFVIGGVALVVGWSLTHIVAWPIRRRWHARGRGRRVERAI
jgi:hypothetical protein